MEIFHGFPRRFATSRAFAGLLFCMKCIMLALLFALCLFPAGRLLGADDKPLPEGVMFSGTGQTWHYPISRTALDVLFIGPFLPSTAPGSIPVEIRKRVLASPEYLSYGLDQYCRVEMRYRQAVRDAGIKNAWITASSNSAIRGF